MSAAKTRPIPVRYRRVRLRLGSKSFAERWRTENLSSGVPVRSLDDSEIAAAF